MDFADVSRSTSRARLGFASLLAAPFALIGTVLLGVAVNTVFTAVRMQSWPTVPATLQHVELKIQGRGSHLPTAVYSYAVDGQQLTGKRVSLYGADNLGSFPQRATDELQGYLDRNQTYPAHVNPKDTHESVLMPALRWEIISFDLVFVILFGGVGWGVLIASYFGYRRGLAEKALAAQYAGQPWRQRVEWTENRIPSSESADAVSAVCLAIFWCSCSWPMMLAFMDKIKAGEYLGLLFLIFPVAGIALVYRAVTTAARARRFGQAYLVLDTFPVRPGEPLRGRIYAPAALASVAEVKLTLHCDQDVYSSTTSRGSRTTTKTLWKQEGSGQVVSVASDNGGVLIQVDLPMPDRFPDSSPLTRRDPVSWKLAARAVLKGADFEAGFEVPVFSR